MAQGFVLFLRIPPETKDKQDNNDDEDDGKKIGSEKPKKILYLLVSIGKVNVISVFHSKGEAMSWIGHTT